MFEDDLDELRDQEQALLDELEETTDESVRHQLVQDLEDLQEEIEEREETQTMYMAVYMLEMLSNV